MKEITSFRDEFAFLSNFFPVIMRINGLSFPTLEHAFVSFKTTDVLIREKCTLFRTPGQAKRFGRSLILRSDWEDIKIPVMEQLVDIKFNIPILSELLIFTEDAILIEGNYWGDKFWGCVWENGVWVGENNLGKILMKKRDKINGKIHGIS